MTALWSAADAVAATGGQASGDWQVTGVSIDTRNLQPGDLFVALKDVRDGHDFVADAFAAGAAAALVTYRPADVPADAPLLIVADVLDALVALGRAGRARTGAQVVGITGSVGKTSTKEMLRAALSGQGRVHAAEASYNNHWGVPLTLARMPAKTDYAIIEIGMSNPGEIAPLARMARPHVVMVTTVAAAHLEAFSDGLDGIAREKASIMDGLEPGGIAVLNADVSTADVLGDDAVAKGITPVWFGQKGGDWALTDVRIAGDATVIRATGGGTDYLFKLAVPGRHFACNALGAIAVAAALGADPIRAALDIATWAPPAGRGTREVVVLDPAIDDANIDLIDDAFNANPTSMVAALEVLAAAQPRDGVGRIARGRRIAILGDMLELGADGAQMHASLADNAHLAQLDVVHCVGPAMKHLYDTLPETRRGLWAHSAADLVPQVARLVDAGDVVLVKGSKGSRVSLVVDALRKLGHRNPHYKQGT